MSAIDRLGEALHDYARRWPEQAAEVAEFHALLRHGVRAFARDHLPGHFTGSAWLVSADGQRVLLTHHRKLGRWLQLGGHADGDPDIEQVALREAQEESGLSGLQLEPPMFDLDRHPIPARANEPLHWHYDLRYVVRAAAGAEDFVISDESNALAWRPIAELVDDPTSEPTIRRMASRWLHGGRA